MREILYTAIEQAIYQKLGDRAFLVSDEELMEEIDDTIFELREEHLTLQEKLRLKEDLLYSFRGYGLISRLLNEEDVTEIMVNGNGAVFYEKSGCLHPYDQSMKDSKKLSDIIQRMVAYSGRKVNESRPIADARLPDGSRLNIVLPPIALDGPVITIRRFAKEPYTMERLVENGTMPLAVSKLLQELVAKRKNIFIFGGTGSGKTTLLNALTEYIGANERIITIEDSAELQIYHIENLVRLEARQNEDEAVLNISIRDLLKTALRMRPDRIIVGEVRGAESFDMLNAMNTGHEGSLSTGHANSAEDMLLRLEMMILASLSVSETVLQRLIASAIDYLIEVRRLLDGRRVLYGIYQVIGRKNDAYELSCVYRYEESKGSNRL